MPSITIQKNVSGLLPSVAENIVATDNVGVLANPSVLAAQPAVLTVRTNNTVGSLTMNNSNHGVITGQRVDLYWATGQCYGAVVGTVAGSVVPIASVSGGNNLPTAASNITVGISTQANFNITGNNLTGLCLNSAVSGYFVFNTGSSDVLAVYLQAGRVYTWDTNAPATNPLAAVNPTQVYMSHSSTTGAITSMQAAAVAH